MAPTLITSDSLFTRGYLAEPITEAPEWGEIGVADLRAALSEIFAVFPADRGRKEDATTAQTAPNIEVEIADAD